MALATWWYEDEQPGLELLEGMTVDTPTDNSVLASLGQLSIDEVARRRALGHRPYLGSIDGEPAAYGWVATRSCDIGELGLAFDLPPGNRYLWDFATLPQFRRRGVYPCLLAEIVRRESPPATRLWIIHAPENLPSGVGISRAGFTSVAELSLDELGTVALAPAGPMHRADEAAGLLHLPLVHEALDPCWACGGCSCDRIPGGCTCATIPHR